MTKDTPITADTCVWLEGHHYPFYFKRVNENGKPVLWGDFSWGFIPAPDCFIESEVEWEDIIYPIPKSNVMRNKNWLVRLRNKEYPIVEFQSVAPYLLTVVFLVIFIGVIINFGVIAGLGVGMFLLFAGFFCYLLHDPLDD